MRVLGIESSCDETGMAVYDEHEGLIAHVLHSQVSVHQRYGGVVPELASRDHVKYLVRLIDQVLQQAGITKKQLDGVAYTSGPGLIGALLTGACFAKSLAFSLGKPAIGVHHLEAHLLAAMLDNPRIKFPYLVLLVSGGHTQLIEALDLGNYRILGDTQDDAVGEAFDKTAKLMGLPYPGGPILAKLADECPESVRQVLPPFPRPMTDRPGIDFSFSGLKTHVLTVWNKSKQDEMTRHAIAYAFQQAVVETLLIKCRRAIQETGSKRLIAAGGVAANTALRSALHALMHEQKGEIYFPRPEFCTDNGAMVAYAGYLQLKQGHADNDHRVDVKARFPLVNDKD